MRNYVKKDKIYCNRIKRVHDTINKLINNKLPILYILTGCSSFNFFKLAVEVRDIAKTTLVADT